MLKDYHDSVGLCKKALACTSLEKKEERVEIEQYMKGVNIMSLSKFRIFTFCFLCCVRFVSIKLLETNSSKKCMRGW